MNQQEVNYLTFHKEGANLRVELNDFGPISYRHTIPIDDALLLEMSARVASVVSANLVRVKNGSTALTQLQEIGRLMSSQLLPEDALWRIREAAPGPLYLRVDEQLVHVPWEIMFDGTHFLAEKFCVGRQVVVSGPNLRRREEQRKEGRMRVLFIIDPTETLPAAEQEARLLVELLDAVPGVEVIQLGGKNVRRLDVLTALEESDIVHFVGHSFYDPDVPSNSGWRLTEEVLTATDLSRIRRPPFLVFSNSCEAGATAPWKSEGRNQKQTFGIGSAFLLSGVSNYVGTLWAVEDDASAQFALAYYRRLFANTSVGEALLDARQTIISERGKEEMTWANYIHYGDPLWHVPLGSVAIQPARRGDELDNKSLRKESKQMVERPGGKLARRPLHFILLCDCSGSMAEDGKIAALNYAVREAIPHMRDAAKSNTEAEVLVQAIKFSDGTQWHIADPTPVDQFRWTDLTANGVTDMGQALRMMAEQVALYSNERGLPPVLVLISDGQPTDDFEGGLQALLAQPWGKKAVRLAIAVGSDADQNVLQRFIGDTKAEVLQAKNPQALVQYVKWVSTVPVTHVSKPKSQTTGGGNDPVPIPSPILDPNPSADIW